MGKKPIEYVCAMFGVEMGRHIRSAINNMPYAARVKPAASILKPSSPAPAADVVGEQIGIEFFSRVSRISGCTVKLIIDPATLTYKAIGSGDYTIWAYLDAIDGTLKIAGLGNEGDKLRIANDGNWGVGVAFTKPTQKPLDDLVLGDFCAAAIVDGNPTLHQSYPRDTLTFIDGTGALHSYDMTETRTPVVTSRCKNLSQTFAYLDNFQAFDRRSAGKNDERLATEVYARLINRNAGGAFDVLRTYGNLAALNKHMLGWKEREPQCGAYIVINENLPNMIPAVPIILGARGLAYDFQGAPLARRRLLAGRTNIIYAANETILQRVLEIVAQAKAAVRTS